MTRCLQPAVMAMVMAIAIAGCGQRDADRIDVAAAASLRTVLPDLVDAYRREHSGHEVTLRYGASDNLAERVRAGSGFDVVLFADRQSLAPLIEAGKIADASVQPLARSELVLAGKSSAANLRFSSLGSLEEHVKIGIADATSVPAGRYAQTYLHDLGVTDALASHVVAAGDVAAVTALILRGEVAAGIVYETDARAANLAVLDRAQGDRAPQPEWFGAPVIAADATDAPAFLTFLTSPAAREIWSRHGFAPP